jgi:hypothetical protein
MGCGFEHGQLDYDPGETPDAGPGNGSDMPIPTPTPRTCAFPVTSDLKLCLEFNDGVLTPKVRDASSGQLDPSATGLQATMRTPTDPAVTIGASSSISIGETATLDISPAITLEAWVRTAQDQNAYVVENESQYALGVDDNGHVYCGMAGTGLLSYQASAHVDAGSWHHIACTFDGSKVRAYLDGSSSDCRSGSSSSINEGGMNGTTIAPSFLGDIDGVRIYARDLGNTNGVNELCAHANKTSCQRQCNSYDYPDGGFFGGFGGH